MKITLLVATLACSAFATQAESPSDFAGEWILVRTTLTDKVAQNSTLRISVSSDTMVIERPGKNRKAQKQKINLKGKLTTDNSRGATMEIKAEVRPRAILVEGKSPLIGVPGADFRLIEEWSLSEDGQELTLETQVLNARRCPTCRDENLSFQSVFKRVAQQ